MKKCFILFYTLFIFLFSSAFSQEGEEVSDNQIQKSQISVTANSFEITKKDPKLIVLSTPEEISKKSYEQKLAGDKKEYLHQKKLMNENYYNLYIIFEKILRANNLDYQNWRLAIKSEAEDFNAYATTANLVVVYSSLYDTFYNNPDALAYVLSHELAHFVLGHHQIALENKVKIAEMKQNVQNWETNANREKFYSRINAYNNSWNSLSDSILAVGYSASALAGNISIDKMYKKEQQLEFDADAEAATLLIRAGYNIENAADAMEFMNQLPDIYTARSTHPPMNFRQRNVNEVVSILDIDELKKEGEANLYNSKVLSAKKSSDKKTLVISKSDKKTQNQYIPNTKDNILMKKAYKYYLNNDMTSSKDYFTKAFEVNHYNYIPALYLSYINEYEFNINHDKKSLKEAVFWEKKAYKLNPYDRNIIQQKEDLIKVFKETKSKKN